MKEATPKFISTVETAYSSSFGWKKNNPIFFLL